MTWRRQSAQASQPVVRSIGAGSVAGRCHLNEADSASTVIGLDCIEVAGSLDWLTGSFRCGSRRRAVGKQTSTQQTIAINRVIGKCACLGAARQTETESSGRVIALLHSRPCCLFGPDVSIALWFVTLSQCRLSARAPSAR